MSSTQCTRARPALQASTRHPLHQAPDADPSSAHYLHIWHLHTNCVFPPPAGEYTYVADPVRHATRQAPEADSKDPFRPANPPKFAIAGMAGRTLSEMKKEFKGKGVAGGCRARLSCHILLPLLSFVAFSLTNFEKNL